MHARKSLRLFYLIGQFSAMKGYYDKTIKQTLTWKWLN